MFKISKLQSTNRIWVDYTIVSQSACYLFFKELANILRYWKERQTYSVRKLFSCWFSVIISISVIFLQFCWNSCWWWRQDSLFKKTTAYRWLVQQFCYQHLTRLLLFDPSLFELLSIKVLGGADKLCWIFSSLSRRFACSVGYYRAVWCHFNHQCPICCHDWRFIISLIRVVYTHIYIYIYFCIFCYL